MHLTKQYRRFILQRVEICRCVSFDDLIERLPRSLRHYSAEGNIRYALNALIADNEVVKVAHGVYADAHNPPTNHEVAATANERAGRILDLLNARLDFIPSTEIARLTNIQAGTVTGILRKLLPQRLVEKRGHQWRITRLAHAPAFDRIPTKQEACQQFAAAHYAPTPINTKPLTLADLLA